MADNGKLNKVKKINTLLTLLIILLLVFIWGNSMLPKEKSDALSRWVLAHIFRFDSENLGFDEGNHILRKAAHMTEFMLLAAAAVLRMRHKRLYWLYGGLAAPAAATDETIQIFSHRGSQVKDVGIDCIGVVLGILIVLLILHSKKQKERT
jgi:VanZ family protein